MLLKALLTRLIRHGRLGVIDPKGRREVYGSGSGPYTTLRIHDWATVRRLATDTSLGFAEAYMDGKITVEDGDLVDALVVALDNIEKFGFPGLAGLGYRFRMLTRKLHQFNRLKASKKNVAHHYDLSGELYDLFLDADRQYSCAYWPRRDISLEEAQTAKKAHIAGKLLLKPGLNVLDIGSGWGGLGLALGVHHGANVLGVTLSQEQLALSRARAEKAGVADRVRFEDRDYRLIEGKFDRIVSVGMFEHVGVDYYETYFRKVNELLADDGVALIHTIGRSSPPGATNSFISKYIFPGGYTPALSEILVAVEKAGLIVTDIEVWRLHYAYTLHEWRKRFKANWAKAEALYDSRFCRMWDMYLAGCEASFITGGQVVFQLQLGRRNDAVPLTRDYLYEADATFDESAVAPLTAKAAAG